MKYVQWFNQGTFNCSKHEISQLKLVTYYLSRYIPMRSPRFAQLPRWVPSSRWAPCRSSTPLALGLASWAASWGSCCVWPPFWASGGAGRRRWRHGDATRKRVDLSRNWSRNIGDLRSNQWGFKWQILDFCRWLPVPSSVLYQLLLLVVLLCSVATGFLDSALLSLCSLASQPNAEARHSGCPNHRTSIHICHMQCKFKSLPRDNKHIPYHTFKSQGLDTLSNIILYKGWDYIACTTAWHFVALHSFIHSTASIPRFTVQLQHARLLANRPWRLVSLWMALWFERVMFLDTPPFPTNGCSSKLGSPELVVSPARHDRFWMILDDFGIIPQLKKNLPVRCILG